MRIKIMFHWDPEAEVWTATSSDVRGLALESGSFDALVERVKMAVPELVKLNGMGAEGCRLAYYTDREDQVPAYG